LHRPHIIRDKSKLVSDLGQHRLGFFVHFQPSVSPS
jgi:hypothetical protein